MLSVTACTTRPSTPPDDAQVRERAASGPAAQVHDTVRSTLASWSLSGQPVRIVLAQPASVSSAPVVIYLPGLGETSAAGERWRTAWAAAGYAVLSVQLLDRDAAAWKPDRARAADSRGLGRERFAGALVGQRVKLLAEVVSQAKARAAAGEPGWLSLDWNRVAIAGFDLGAYTAMTIAGEHVRYAEDAAGLVQVQAAIAISPYASVAAGSFGTRYRDIRLPVLSVTSDVDADALGVIEAAYLRDAPHAHMDGPNKYLLWLRGLPHAWLSGHADGVGPQSGADPDAPAQDSAGSPGSDSRSPRRGRTRERAGDGGGASIGRDEAAQASLSPSALQLRVMAVQQVSIAFLDAYLKQDAPARQWLSVDASRWLGTSGELRRK